MEKKKKKLIHVVSLPGANIGWHGNKSYLLIYTVRLIGNRCWSYSKSTGMAYTRFNDIFSFSVLSQFLADKEWIPDFMSFALVCSELPDVSSSPFPFQESQPKIKLLLLLFSYYYFVRWCLKNLLGRDAILNFQ